MCHGSKTCKQIINGSLIRNLVDALDPNYDPVRAFGDGGCGYSSKSKVQIRMVNFFS